MEQSMNHNETMDSINPTAKRIKGDTDNPNFNKTKWEPNIDQISKYHRRFFRVPAVSKLVVPLIEKFLDNYSQKRPSTLDITNLCGRSRIVLLHTITTFKYAKINEKLVQYEPGKKVKDEYWEYSFHHQFRSTMEDRHPINLQSGRSTFTFCSKPTVHQPGGGLISLKKYNKHKYIHLLRDIKQITKKLDQKTLAELLKSSKLHGGQISHKALSDTELAVLEYLNLLLDYEVTRRLIRDVWEDSPSSPNLKTKAYDRLPIGLVIALQLKLIAQKKLIFDDMLGSSKYNAFCEAPDAREKAIKLILDKCETDYCEGGSVFKELKDTFGHGEETEDDFRLLEKDFQVINTPGVEIARFADHCDSFPEIQEQLYNLAAVRGDARGMYNYGVVTAKKDPKKGYEIFRQVRTCFLPIFWDDYDKEFYTGLGDAAQAKELKDYDTISLAEISMAAYLIQSKTNVKKGLALLEKYADNPRAKIQKGIYLNSQKKGTGIYLFVEAVKGEERESALQLLAETYLELGQDREALEYAQQICSADFLVKIGDSFHMNEDNRCFAYWELAAKLGDKRANLNMGHSFYNQHNPGCLTMTPEELMEQARKYYEAAGDEAQVRQVMNFLQNLKNVRDSFGQMEIYSVQ